MCKEYTLPSAVLGHNRTMRKNPGEHPVPLLKIRKLKVNEEGVPFPRPTPEVSGKARNKISLIYCSL